MTAPNLFPSAPRRPRLFVPLASDPYRWFASGAKTWELRAMRGQYSPKNVYAGRRVELRRGYSTPDSLWGTITGVIRAECICQFFDHVTWQSVICAPEVSDRREAERRSAEILGMFSDDGAVIGFCVEIDQPCPKCNEVGK